MKFFSVSLRNERLFGYIYVIIILVIFINMLPTKTSTASYVSDIIEKEDTSKTTLTHTNVKDSLNQVTPTTDVVTTKEGDVKKVIIIDAGHGGADPGKIVGNLHEKNINLQIALIVEKKLNDAGYEVIMTRTSDDDLPDNKKSEMYKRKLIANDSNADIFVSIHQNSSSSSSAKGAQVYYFAKSENSKELAQYIDDSIKQNANPSKKFDLMPNTSFYVLKKTLMPAVLIECGFMSNSGERWLLTTPEYQEKMAQAIFIGIENYFNR